ncbi:MAG: sporulation integral membrane protein YlbJ [Hydrogenibacillus sp.]|nr:sporulation integral membrane protein YlbJ [Hydrogenibacillus sp.]
MVGRSRALILIVGVMWIVVAYLSHPADVFQAARQGTAIWWDVVFPATLPFLILAEMSLGLGIPHFFGVFLRPLMRPLFRLPGVASFVLTMGFASGYPMTARLTVSMRQRGDVTRLEAERMVAFATTSDPVFISAVVAVGLFQVPAYAAVLAAVHYGSAVLIGLLYRFYGVRAEDEASEELEHPQNAAPHEPLLGQAYRAMENARRQDGRPFGRLLADSVQTALSTTFVIGGLIIFFSVLMQIFETTGVMRILERLFRSIARPLGVPDALLPALTHGLFEVTIGVEAAAQAPGALAPAERLAVASAVLAWAGLSVQSQVATIIAHTDIRFAPFWIARLLHTALAPIVFRLSWPCFTRLNPHLSEPVFADMYGALSTSPLERMEAAAQRLLFAVALLFALSAAVALVHGLIRLSRRWLHMRKA